MKYKLLVLDVDGTLLNNQKEISPRTLAALLKVQQMGVHIVLASGRPTNGVMPIAEKLELNHYGGYILSYNGGQIINVQTVGSSTRFRHNLLACNGCRRCKGRLSGQRSNGSDSGSPATVSRR